MSMADDLVATLAAGALPVRRLRPPLRRAALWLAFAAAIVAAFAAAHPLRDDILHCLRQPLWLFMTGMALATGVLDRKSTRLNSSH